jgi:uncharacterized protein affecting Mg2+/Co2+ transport
MIFVAEEDGNHIRKIDLAAGQVSTVAGSGKAGIKNGAASKAKFSYPGGLGLDTRGNIYVGDYESHRIRLISTNASFVVI